MSDPQKCPKCGADLPKDAPDGLCPKCLVETGFESDVRSRVDGSTSDTEAPRVDDPSPGDAFSAPSPVELANRFPHLEIVELLGQGGMGAVYTARQKNLDRLVALKLIRPEATTDPAFAERFNREAKTLARLSHQHIVAVYDFGEIEYSETKDQPARPLYYFLMEFVDGANLRQLMRAGKLSPEQALAMVPQICDALQYAHDEGVVHRDIKPENILLDKRGRVKIADFGLAKLATRSEDEFTLTGTHQVMGTLRYMAPEQMEGSHAVDHRADIYSLGVVFYEMLTGEAPMGHFDPPSKKVQVDVRLDEVVLRSLAREPERRYQHAGDVKTDVESISIGRHAMAVGEGDSSNISRSARDPNLQNALADEIVELIERNTVRDYMAAIRTFRVRTGAGLAEAKSAVAEIANNHGIEIRQLTPHERLKQIAVGGALTLIILTVAGLKGTKGLVGWGALAIYTVFLLAMWRGVRAERASGATELLPRGGSKQWGRWWRQQHPWFRKSVNTVLLAPYIGGLLLFASFHGSGNRQAFDHSIGYPAPWYTVHKDASGFESSIHLYSSTWIILAVGLLAFYVRWRLEQAAAETPSKFAFPKVHAILWSVILVMGFFFCWLPLLLESLDVPSRNSQAFVHWRSSPEGVTVEGTDMQSYLQLAPSQTKDFDNVLRATRQQYERLIRRHTKVSLDENQYVIAKTEPFPEDVTTLVDGMWSEFDAFLDEQQQGKCRARFSIDQDFRTGREGRQVRIWKVGSWYQYQQSYGARGFSSPPIETPRLPDRYESYWNEAFNAQSGLSPETGSKPRAEDDEPALPEPGEHALPPGVANIPPPPLLDAVRRGDVAEVKRLLDEGASVNDNGRGGKTPLMAAAKTGNASLAATLALLGADVNQSDYQGRTALIYAAENGHANVLAALIDVEEATKGEPGDENRSERIRSLPEVELDLLGDEDPGVIKISYQAQDNDLQTAQMKAAARGDVEWFKKVWPRVSASPPLQDAAGRTPLMHAIENDQLALVRYLAQHQDPKDCGNYFSGAGAILRDAKRRTALQLAEEPGREEMLRVVREAALEGVDDFTQRIQDPVSTATLPFLYTRRAQTRHALGQDEQAKEDLKLARQSDIENVKREDWPEGADWLDLLADIDLPRHEADYRGRPTTRWKLKHDGYALTQSSNELATSAILVPPVQVSGAYSLEVQFVVDKGDETGQTAWPIITFPVHDRHLDLFIDHQSGPSVLAVSDRGRNPEDLMPPDFISAGRVPVKHLAKHTLRLSVRYGKGQEAVVTSNLDGRSLVYWKGGAADLADKRSPLPQPGLIGLGACCRDFNSFLTSVTYVSARVALVRSSDQHAGRVEAFGLQVPAAELKEQDRDD